MKKFLMPLIIGLCSCSSENSDVQTVGENAKTVEISIADMNSDVLESRMSVTDRVKYLFQNNDRLGIFPITVSGYDENKKPMWGTPKGSQVEFPIELPEGTTAETVLFDGGGWAFKAGYGYAAYYPYELLSNRGREIPFSFNGQLQKQDDNREHLSNKILMIAQPTMVENGAINFSLCNVESVMRLDLYLPEGKTYKSVSLYAKESVIPQEKIYDIFSTKLIKNGNLTEVTINDNVVKYDNHLTIGLDNLTPNSENGRLRVWLTFPAVGDSYQSLTAVVKDSEGLLYVGDVLVNNSEAPLFTSTIDRNEYNLLKAYPQLSDGVSGSIEDWEMGEEILGSAN